MIHCAIIGAGQIGSRHLQSLALLKGSVRIELVDPSLQALKFSEQRFEEIHREDPGSIELSLEQDIEKLSPRLDIAIIATSSDVRAQVIEKVIEEKSVRHLILEKVLFQKPIEYHAVKKLLQEKMIPTWVNCWMRTTDLFKQIKSALDLNDSIQMKIEGPRWGMGTNSIHFMDLLSYFAECGDFKFIGVHLEDQVPDSKREGFKEFMGHLEGRNSRGDSLDLICKDEEDGPIMLEIQNGPEKYMLVTNFADHIDFKSSNGLASRIGKASLPYQSKMTHIWVNDILTKGSCDLPTYSDSMSLHLELIRVFSDHFQKTIGKGIDACPIT